MTRPLARDAGASLHHQLSSVLRSAIASGRYSPGTNLPGENVLMQDYEVSRATVRRALLTLEGEGLIDRQQGRGTRVVPRQTATINTPLDAHLERIELAAARTTVRLLGHTRVRAPYAVATALHLDDGTDVIRIDRVRRTRSGPLRYLTSFVPLGVGGSFTKRDLQRRTLLDLLARTGRAVRRAEDEIGATLAEPAVAVALEVATGTPLLELARTMYDGDGLPVAFQWTLLPPGRTLRIIMQAELLEPMSPIPDRGVLRPVPPA